MKQLGIAITIALLASPALADRVAGSPPTNCPTGSYPHVDHGGPHCAFVPCASDADCAWDPELSCGPQASICVLVDEFNTYARRPAQRERAGSACVDGACAEGECRTDRFCVRGGNATEPEASTQPEASMEPVSMQPAVEPATMDTQANPTQNEESGCAVGGAASLPFLFLFVFVRRRG